MLGGADVLRSLEFTAEENRLRDSGGETPDDGIERADCIELRGAEPARGADRKTRQARGASLVHAVKGGGETAFGGDDVGPAFEDLRGQTGGHGSRLAGKGTSRVESRPAG